MTGGALAPDCSPEPCGASTTAPGAAAPAAADPTPGPSPAPTAPTAPAVSLDDAVRLTPGLRGLYTFDAASSSGAANDYVGAGALPTASLYGVDPDDLTVGSRRGRALRSQTSLTVGGPPSGGRFTVQAWVRLDAGGTSMVALGRDDYFMILLHEDGQPMADAYLLGRSSCGGLTAGADVGDRDGWHLLTMTVDGGSARLYLDDVGSPVQALDGCVGNVPSDLGNDTEYPGLLDDLALYDTVLTPAQISAIYEAGR